jgi:hypothetical protein
MMIMGVVASPAPFQDEAEHQDEGEAHVGYADLEHRRVPGHQ